jgi:hypothetical protein
MECERKDSSFAGGHREGKARCSKRGREKRENFSIKLDALLDE